MGAQPAVLDHRDMCCVSILLLVQQGTGTLCSSVWQSSLTVAGCLCCRQAGLVGVLLGVVCWLLLCRPGLVATIMTLTL
jgi:hypothetical protein